MSTHSHSNRLAAEQTTTAHGEPSAVEHPERPHAGGSVLARIPDVRPNLEDDPPPDGRRIRVDAAQPHSGGTNAVLRRDHSSWHISRRLMVVVGLVVAVAAIAVFLRMRNDSTQSVNQTDATKPADGDRPTIDWQADRPAAEPSYPFGRPHDGHSHDRGDESPIPAGISQRAPDYFSERSSPPVTGRLNDRNVAGEADTAAKQPDYRFGPDDRHNAAHHDQLATTQRQSIFPWRRSGQRLRWQQPNAKTSPGADPRSARYGDRFSGGGPSHRWDSSTREPPQYPDTGAGGRYVPPQDRDPSRFSPPNDIRSARGGTTLGDDARRSTYYDPRRGGASFDGRIEPPTYRALR